jgi:cyclase
MLKKRVIFTLLFSGGYFVLSRNFRLQKVGKIDWLQHNYDFSNVAFNIDELVVLDVTRNRRDFAVFCDALQKISAGCFAPISAGGGVTSVESARRLLRSGADKIVLNSALWDDPPLVGAIAREFGRQCVVGSVDLQSHEENEYVILTHNGKDILEMPATEALNRNVFDQVGEIYLNCIDRDGTGQGYDFGILDLLADSWNLPVILAGGVGNSRHLTDGLADDRVNAVATAHLFNFVGDGLYKARRAILEGGYELAHWPDLRAVELTGQLKTG